MLPRFILLAGGLGLWLASPAWGQATAPGDRPTAKTANAAPANLSTNQPAKAAPAAAAAGNLNTSATNALKELPGTSRAGGMKVDLKGRFHSTTVASIGPDGKVTIRCVTSEEPAIPAPAGNDGKR